MLQKEKLPGFCEMVFVKVKNIYFYSYAVSSFYLIQLLHYVMWFHFVNTIRHTKPILPYVDSYVCNMKMITNENHLSHCNTKQHKENSVMACDWVLFPCKPKEENMGEKKSIHWNKQNSNWSNGIDIKIIRASFKMLAKWSRLSIQHISIPIL